MNDEIELTQLTYGRAVFAMPVVDVVGGTLLLEHDIGVAFVEFAVELGVLLDWLELLDAIDFHWVLACLCKEGLSLGAKLADVGVHVLAVEHGVVVVSLNHGD